MRQSRLVWFESVGFCAAGGTIANVTRFGHVVVDRTNLGSNLAPQETHLANPFQSEQRLQHIAVTPGHITSTGFRFSHKPYCASDLPLPRSCTLESERHRQPDPTRLVAQRQQIETRNLGATLVVLRVH